MLDIAVAYSRFQFLGEEFLTWLWYVVDNDLKLLRQLDEDLVALEIGNRMVLVNRRLRDGVETVTIRGDDANMDEGLLTLRKGGMVAEAHLIYKSGDHEWQFNLKGESLNLSSVKVPPTGKMESREDLEGVVIEKIDLCNKAVSLTNRLYQHFIELRLGPEWTRHVVPAVRKWINTG